MEPILRWRMVKKEFLVEVEDTAEGEPVPFS